MDRNSPFYSQWQDTNRRIKAADQARKVAQKEYDSFQHQLKDQESLAFKMKNPQTKYTQLQQKYQQGEGAWKKSQFNYSQSERKSQETQRQIKRQINKTKMDLSRVSRMPEGERDRQKKQVETQLKQYERQLASEKKQILSQKKGVERQQKDLTKQHKQITKLYNDWQKDSKEWQEIEQQRQRVAAMGGPDILKKRVTRLERQAQGLEQQRDELERTPVTGDGQAQQQQPQYDQQGNQVYKMTEQQRRGLWGRIREAIFGPYRQK